MAFWDRFRKKPPPVGEDTVPPPDEVGAAVGALRNGKKHGRWKERDDKPATEWDYKAGKSVTLDIGWTELDYVDGVKQGPFVRWWGNGKLREQCAYLDDELHGPKRHYNRDGVLAVEGAYSNGKATGWWKCLPDTGSIPIDYEGEFVEGKRQGPWRYRSYGTEERGSYVAGNRVGEFTVTTKTGAIERGSFRDNKRDGAWTVETSSGVIVEEGSYAADKRSGTWTLRRTDGSVRARGTYAEGKPTGEWTFVAPDGSERGRAAITDEAAIASWDDCYTAIDLLANFAATKEWVERVRSTFTELATAWQVTEKTDKHGQTWRSAPIDAYWQLQLASGVPIQSICRDECWSKIVKVIEAQPVADALVDLVIARCGRYPSYVGRDWLTRIVDGEHDDPRTKLVCRFEPGRSLSKAQLARFAERVPHLRELRLRECSFPDGITPLFERGFPELQRLVVVRNHAPSGAYCDLVALLANATWAGKLEQLAILDSEPLEDRQLAALFANPALSSLKHVTLHYAAFGQATATTLASARSLVSLDLYSCTIDADALIAIGKHPSLEELTCRLCELPKLTTRQAREVGPSPKLQRLILRGTFDLDAYQSGADAWTPYGLARRLAVMPALGSVEELDLSNNDLDELAVRVLARSPHLGKLRVLDWTGNDAEPDALREAFPALKIQTETRHGNVVVLG